MEQHRGRAGNVGRKVILKSEWEDFPRGTIGTISEADGSDSSQPYRVEFQGSDYGMWPRVALMDFYEEPGERVNAPKHYTSHPSGVEVITITEHMGFNLGNVVKYVIRCDIKDDGVNAITDLEKAAYYINREIEKRKKAASAA